MKLSTILDKLFEQEISTKYQIYENLFTNLPYDKIDNTGMLLPILADNCKKGLEASKSPKEIMENFFSKFADIEDEKLQIDFLFLAIQYIERQIVLFDSVEDAAFENISKYLPVGTLNNLYQIARQRNIKKEIKEKLKTFKVRVVFTAHPTQFYPDDVLHIISEFESAVKTNDIIRISMLMKQLSRTPFIKKQKPTPLEEARSIMYYMRYIYYNTVGLFHDKLYDLFFESVDEFVPVIELGFWPGGDRDGNPFVTAKMTRQVAEELKYDILKCYYHDIKKLKMRLTFKVVRDEITKLKDRLYDNLFKGKQDLTYEYFVEEVMRMRELLIRHHNGMFLDMLDAFLRKIKTFGFHFASLDIRQDSGKHFEMMNKITKRSGGKMYQDMSDEEKIAFLLLKNISLQSDDFDDPIHKDTIENIKQLKEIQKQNGEKSVHRYIISNSTSIFSVLEVFALFRFCGYKEKDISFDIVPLFETIEGLSLAYVAMEKLYADPIYKEHLKRRKNKQTIMLGFSDGTKDGGYVKANFAIYTAKKILTEISRRHHIDVIFFDGRGGPPARGGGKTHQFYASQGPEIADNEIHLTVQGQTISSQYGSSSQALYNFEQLVTAGLSSGFRIGDKSHANMSEQGKRLISELGEIAYTKYTALKEHPLFLSYLENKSALKYYSDTNIGSRPSKRGAQSQLKLSDLRAIPFVGSWSQLKQNVPGYFGFGTAIQGFVDEGRENELQRLYKESLYFKTLVQNSMMSLAKTYFPLTHYIKNDPLYGAFWKILYDEYLLSVKNLLLITEEKELMEKEVLNKRSIAYREKIALPLLVIQQYALQKIEEDDPYRADYEKAVIRSLFGNINASRNSA